MTVIIVIGSKVKTVVIVIRSQLVTVVIIIESGCITIKVVIDTLWAATFYETNEISSNSTIPMLDNNCHQIHMHDSRNCHQMQCHDNNKHHRF